MKYLRLIPKSFVDFFRDGGMMLAGSVSYFSMMALVPFCLFLITVFGYFLGHYPGLYEFLADRLTSFFPSITSGITNELGKLINFRVIGTFSLVLYGVLSIQVFASLENALNIVFKVTKKRNFFWSIVLSLLIITFIILMLFISFMATTLIPLLEAFRNMFPDLKIGLISRMLIQYAVPFLTVFFMVTMMYVFFPRARVRASHAYAGAMFTTIFLEIAKHFFTWYVGTVMKLGTIYGPLSAFIVFLLWVFYSSCIFLIGAELVHNLSPGKK